MNWNFMDALAAMENGQAVKRDVWTIMDGYRIVLPGSKHVYMVINVHNQPQVQWAPISLADFNAQDWRLLDNADVNPPVEVPVDEIEEAA